MGIPSGEARLCTPAGTEAVISALAPTAPQAIKEMPHGVTPQQMHTPQGLHPRANAPYWPCPDTLAQTRQVGALELRCPGESVWPTSYDYNWCEKTAQGQTKTGP